MKRPPVAVLAVSLAAATSPLLAAPSASAVPSMVQSLAVLSPLAIGGVFDVSADGNAYFGSSLTKVGEFERLNSAGVSIPATGSVMAADGRHTAGVRVDAALRARTVVVFNTVTGSETSFAVPASSPDIEAVTDISFDGSVVVYQTGDTGQHHLHVWNSVTGTDMALDSDLPRTVLNSGGTDGRVSDDGRYVAFTHINFVAGCTVYGPDCQSEIYRTDLASGARALVSKTPAGAAFQGNNGLPEISGDGRVVAWLTDSEDLTLGSSHTWKLVSSQNGAVALHRRDLHLDQNDLERPAVSYFGFRIGYIGGVTASTVAGFAGTPQVFVLDGSGRNQQLSMNGAIEADGPSRNVAISDDGRTVTFSSFSTNLPAGGPAIYVARLDVLTDTNESPRPIPPALAADGVARLQVAGRGGVPADAKAAVLNVTVTNPGRGGYVTVWPCDADRPLASNLNFVAAQTVPNAVVSRLASDGTVCLFSRASTDLIVDVNGFVPATSGYVPLLPDRLLDTRHGEADTVPNVPAREVTHLPVRGRSGVGPTASAVVLNVTAVNPAGAGFVTVWPCDQPLPTASNLNVVKGQTVPNLVLSTVAADGSVCLFSNTAIDLVVDVSGYLAPGASFLPLTPTRLLDSRLGQEDITPNLGAAGAEAVVVNGRGGVPANAAAVVLNITATNPASAGYVTAYPCDGARPTASNVNHAAGQTVPNLVFVPVGQSGTVCLYHQAATDLIVDVLGAFPTTADVAGITPLRLLDTR